MFTRPFRTKSNTQMKGSEKKRLKANLIKHYPQLTEEDVQEFFQKEAISVMRIITHGGEHVVVYIKQKMPIFFEFEDVTFPTVYSLWQFPSLLPSFTMWPQIFNKLKGGADLMLPGIVLKGPKHIKSYGTLQKGDRIAINTTANRAAVAVGVAALSSYDMYMAGQYGKAVKILHILGDELWSYGAKIILPQLGPPDGFDDERISSTVASKEPPVNETVSEDSLLEKCQNLKIDETTNSHNSVTILSDECDVPDSSNAVNSSQDYVDSSVEETEKKNEKNDQEQMDQLFKYCFLKALKTTARKVDLPLLVSKFYKLHMLQACPESEQLDIKKTSYRKLTKFLSSMEDLGIVKVKELKLGVESIVSIDFSNQHLREFVLEDPVREPVKEEANVKPVIMELYKITAPVFPVFAKFGFRKGVSLPMTEVRKYVTEYVKSEKLQDPKDKRMVTIDATLRRVFTNPLTVAVSWEDLFDTCIEQMTKSYQMCFPDEKVIEHKGKLDPIDIQIGKRTGNKKVTLINNLELYGIIIQEFARECQHGVAASTSISQVPGKKSQQLLVQGNQVLFVGNLLTEKYKIPKKFIRGLENATRPRK